MPPVISTIADAIDLVVRTLERELPHSAVWIGHLDTERGVLRVVASGGDAFGLERGIEAPLESSFCQVMASGEGARVCGDVPADPAYAGLPAARMLGVRSFAGTPLTFADGTAVGTLCAFHHESSAFSARELALMEAFAALLARELEHERQRLDHELVAAELRRQASQDPLTGVLNRRAFEADLERAWRRGQGALAIVDIDRFKAINDERGHLAGDAVLRELAAAMRALAGRRETVARLGGDEFAALLRGDPQRWAAELRTRLRGVARVSVGHAPLAGAASPTDALAAADAALYADKRGAAAST